MLLNKLWRDVLRLYRKFTAFRQQIILPISLYPQLCVVPCFGSKNQTLLCLITQKNKTNKRKYPPLEDHFKMFCCLFHKMECSDNIWGFSNWINKSRLPMLEKAFKDFSQLQKTNQKPQWGSCSLFSYACFRWEELRCIPKNNWSPQLLFFFPMSKTSSRT